MSKSKAFLQLIADNPPPCKTIGDPELFFPSYAEGNEFQVKQAKAVCRKCPLTTQLGCLEFALDTDDQFAVLGGTTPAERTIIKRRREAQEGRLAA
jgi:WhiB family transcriptional regulator, redox-sensing transcriptional regulator